MAFLFCKTFLITVDFRVSYNFRIIAVCIFRMFQTPAGFDLFMHQLNCVTRKFVFGPVRPRFETNSAVQPLKMARGSIFRIGKRRAIMLSTCKEKTKALISCTVLCLCFAYYEKKKSFFNDAAELEGGSKMLNGRPRACHNKKKRNPSQVPRGRET